MIKVINEKVYDTEKATLVAEVQNRVLCSAYLDEDLYISNKGQWFKTGTGGIFNDDEIIDGSDLLLFTKDEAFEWFVVNQMFLDNSKKVLEKYFNDMVSEG